jgi:hypothetical protein
MGLLRLHYGEGRKVGRIYCSLVFAFLLFSFLVVTNRTFADATVMHVEPSSVKDIAVGQSFTVNLTVTNVPALFTWQIMLFYNSTTLTCTAAVYPTADGIFAGHGTVPVAPVIDNSAGSVSFGASLSGSDIVNGSGIMCQITFKVNATGTSGLNYSTPYGADTFLLDGDLNVAPASTEDGFFTNVIAPPPTTHDVAITGLSFSNNNPIQGDSVAVTVVALNNGTATESTFDVKVSNGTTPIGTQTVSNLAAGDTKTLTFNWNTSGVPTGSNTVTANATSVADETNLSNNIKTGTVNVQPIRHDIAITGLSFSNNSPKQGDSITITVVVKNNGTATEDAFDVRAQTVITLSVNDTKSLTFNWNTSGASLGQNAITANASTVPGEIDLSNNIKTGTVSVLSSTAKSADINGDGRFDMRDIAIVCWSFGTHPGDGRWNDSADISGSEGVPDGAVDQFDIAAAVKHFWNKP